jgi:hypothetical protein
VLNASKHEVDLEKMDPFCSYPIKDIGAGDGNYE